MTEAGTSEVVRAAPIIQTITEDGGIFSLQIPTGKPTWTRDRFGTRHEEQESVSIQPTFQKKPEIGSLIEFPINSKGERNPSYQVVSPSTSAMASLEKRKINPNSTVVLKRLTPAELEALKANEVSPLDLSEYLSPASAKGFGLLE